MATRQYIGARYVPKFYQNSVDGSSSWQSNVVYEPLTWVTLTNGHMYISKKQVPATVGTPASNIDYWLDIGSYNGFIDELQNQIDDLETVVEKIPTDRKFVLIGDSFACGIRGGGLSWVTGWANYFENIHPNQTFWYDPASDEPFEGISAFLTSSPKNFIGQLNYVHDNKMNGTNPEEITDVIVIGGTNEPTTSSANDIARYIAETFKPAVESLFPNANVKIGCFGLNARAMCEKNNAYAGYLQGCKRASFEFMPELYNLGTNPDWNSGYGHLTQAGYDYCNPIIAQRIFNGTCTFKWFKQIPLTIDSNEGVAAYGGSITYEMVLEVSNDSVKVKVEDTARYKSWAISNRKTYSGSGSLTLSPLTFTTKMFTMFVNGQSFDSPVVFNLDTHLFDNKGCAMSLYANADNNGGYIRFQTVPRSAMYSSPYDTISFSWDGSTYHELEVLSSY